MLGRKYEDENCSVARALEVVGERWSLLILRNALFAGTARFTDFQRSLGVAPNILTTRLDNFVAAGVMERRPSVQSSGHLEYVLTDKGRDLQPVVIALAAWGDRWAAPNGPPIVYTHSACGTVLHQAVHCSKCGEVSNTEVESRPGPGLRPPAENADRPPSPATANP